MKKLNKQEQIKKLKLQLLEEQDYICPLCKIDMVALTPFNICLDHDHETGLIRGVLCRNCNSMEGKIHNCIRRAKRLLEAQIWFDNLITYWGKARTCRSFPHPLYKTPEQKKEARRKRVNKRNRIKRSAKP